MTNFAPLIMNRTFHHKVSLHSLVGIAVVAVAAFCAFWYRSAAGAVAGLVLMGAVVSMVERTIHTVYVLTGDGLLVVSRGRFSRRVVVRLADISSVETVRAGLLPVAYVLVRYGAGRELSLQPDNAEGFVSEVKRRMEK